jgi:uncharacterized RDD family membrane protein YckC
MTVARAERVPLAATRMDARTIEDAAPRAYSGLVTRTIAFAIDAAIIDVVAVAVGAIVALVFSILPVSHDLRVATAAAGAGVFIVWAAAYFVTFWTTTGQTPGNRAMRIRVVRADGSALRPRHALARLLGMVLGLPLLWGYLAILLSDRRRALHDRMAGTVVVADPVMGNARAPTSR